MWGALIGAGLGAGLGMIQGDRKAAADRKFNLGQAEMTKYSPWTGRAGEIKQGHDPMDSVMQGGMAGGMFGNQFGGAEAATGGVAQAAKGSSPLGGQQMAQELGQFGQGPMFAQAAQAPTLYSQQIGQSQKYGLGPKFSFNR